MRHLATLARFRTAYAELLSAAEAVRAEIERAADPHGSAPADIALVQATVAQAYGLPVERLSIKVRDSRTALARHVAMALCGRYTPHTRVVIGRAFGLYGQMVRHAERSVADRCATDSDFAAEFEAVTTKVAAALAVFRG